MLHEDTPLQTTEDLQGCIGPFSGLSFVSVDVISWG